MLNNKDRAKELDMPSNRSFGFTFAAFFLLLSAIKFNSANYSFAKCSLVFSFAFSIITFLSPKFLLPFNKLWTKLGALMHKVATPIIMAVLYFAVISPMAIIMRFCKWDPLRLNYDSATKSYWFKKDQGNESGSMKNQF